MRLAPLGIGMFLFFLLAPGYCGADATLTIGVLNDDDQVVAVQAGSGVTSTIAVFYEESEDAIQGFQIALTVDCTIEVDEDSLSIEGTGIESVGVEFTNFEVDSDPDDGDGCELGIGILLDALPPFENQTVPTATTPTELCRFEFTPIDDLDANCYAVAFAEDITPGISPISTLVIVDNEAATGLTTVDGEICVEAAFVRGDCNQTGTVDVSDGVFFLAYLFNDGRESGCLGACDFNGDELSDLADAISLLRYIFLGGDAPAAPFPLCTATFGADCDETTCL